MKIIRRLIEIFINIICYALIFYLVSKLFKSFEIDQKHVYLYSFISSVLIYILNLVVKPILVRLTLPITAMTMGLFYFVNNVIILKLVDYIMGPRVNFKNIWVLFVISILLSIINNIVNNVLIKRIKGALING